MSVQNYSREAETVIDLADLGRWISKRVLIIGAMCLAGAAAGGAYYSITTKPATEEALKASLSVDKVEEVAQIYGTYSAKRNQLESASDYLADSALLQVNAQAAPKITSTYTVTSNIPRVWELYASTALRDADLQSIADVLDLESPEYAPEMVEFSGYGAANTVLSDAGASSASVMTVTVYAYTEEEARAVEEIVSTRINNVTTALESSGADIVIAQQGAVYTEAYDADLAQLQQKALSAQSDIQNALQTYRTSYVDKLSSAELAYFNALDGILPSAGSSAKPIAVGTELGALIAICAYCAQYLCAGVIHTSDDAERITGALVIGRVKPDADSVALAVPTQEIIAIAAAQSGGVEPRIFIQADAQGKEIAQKLAQENSNVTVSAGNALNDAGACGDMLKAHTVIICASVGCTKSRDLEAVKRMLVSAGQDIAGVVLIEEP